MGAHAEEDVQENYAGLEGKQEGKKQRCVKIVKYQLFNLPLFFLSFYFSLYSQEL